MSEIVIYSCVIILLPIIPAYILYAALPVSDNEVDGTYHGLKIKLKGAFAGYFLLALMLTSFIGARIATQSDYEYWTVEGLIHKSVSDPLSVHFSIEPPDQDIYSNGKFEVRNVPILKERDKHAKLSLTYYDMESIISLRENTQTGKGVNVDVEYRVMLDHRNRVMKIVTPIKFNKRKKEGWDKYVP